MKKLLGITLVALIAFAGCASKKKVAEEAPPVVEAPVQNEIFGSFINDEIAVVGNFTGDKVEFYAYYDEQGLTVEPGMTLSSLPSGSKNLFSYGYGILGVVADNQVQFFACTYDYEEKKANWAPAEQGTFNLPEGFTNVFSLNGILGVVVDNQVQFYVNDDGWIDFESAAPLPEGFTKVFPYGNEYLGVVVGNEVQFYTSEGADAGLAAFSLPEGCENLFPYGNEYLGVVANNQVQFYAFVGENWEEYPDLTLAL